MSPGKVSPPEDRLDTIQYIEQMARELRGLAEKADVALVAYLLAMVEDETAAIVRQIGSMSA